MQKYLSFPILTLFVFLNWVLFSDNAGSFRILTPGEMHHATKELTTSAGPIVVHTFFTFPTSDSSRYFAVSYYDIDTSGLQLNDTFNIALLQNIKQDLLQSFHANEAYSRTLDLHGGYGLMFRAGYNEARHVMKGQIRFYPPRIYILQVLLPHDAAMSPDADRFFHSFEHL